MKMLRRLFPERIKPEFGNKDQILLVRKYDEILRGIKPVERLIGWETDDELQSVSALIECPCCFIEHKVYTSNDTGEFEYDSQYCVMCETEFCFHDTSEFDLYVKQDHIN